MNKVVISAIILAMVPCAGISAMQRAIPEREVQKPRAQRPQIRRRIDLDDNNQVYIRELAFQQRMEQLERYNGALPERAASFFSRNV